MILNSRFLVVWHPEVHGLIIVGITVKIRFDTVVKYPHQVVPGPWLDAAPLFFSSK